MSTTGTRKTKKFRQSTLDALLRTINTSCKDLGCDAAGTCKHEGERANARSIYQRIMANIAAHAQNTGTFSDDAHGRMWAEIYAKGFDQYGNSFVIGHKHHQVRGVAYAPAIRAEIRMARKVGKLPLLDSHASGAELHGQRLELYRVDPIGRAPADVKISVTSGSGLGSSVEIAITAPVGWGWTAVERTDNKGAPYTAYEVTEALEELAKELRRVGQAYNRSYGSNVMTGCHANAFTLSVAAVDPRWGGHVLIG